MEVLSNFRNNVIFLIKKIFFRRLLEKNWEKIAAEGKAILESRQGVMSDKQNLVETGDWGIFHLFRRGVMIEDNCRRAPFTCSFMKPFTAATSNKRGVVCYITNIFPLLQRVKAFRQI